MKIITFLFSALLLAGFSDAQTFSVQYTGASLVHAPVQYVSDSVVKGPVWSDLADTFAVITNLTGGAINLEAVRLVNNMPAGWSTEMCLDVCYAPTVDTSDIITIGKGGVQYVYLHCFTFSSLDETGNVQFKILNSDNPSENYSIDFYVISDSTLTGIAQNNVGPINIEAFPNPFSSTAIINLKNYRIIHGNAPLDFTMYDLLGNSVQFKTGITGDQIAVNRNNLPSGIYFYKLMNGSKEAAFGRLSVQ